MNMIYICYMISRVRSYYQTVIAMKHDYNVRIYITIFNSRSRKSGYLTGIYILTHSRIFYIWSYRHILIILKVIQEALI